MIDGNGGDVTLNLTNILGDLGYFHPFLNVSNLNKTVRSREETTFLPVKYVQRGSQSLSITPSIQPRGLALR